MADNVELKKQLIDYTFYRECGFYRIAMIKRLMLVSCEHTPFTSKKTHEEVDGWKYLFLKPPETYKNEKERFLVAWGKDGTFRNDATEKLVYDDTCARDYPFKLKEFDGEVSEQLVESSENES